MLPIFCFDYIFFFFWSIVCKSFGNKVVVVAKEMEMHADIVLIVLPLKSIMKDQIEEMERAWDSFHSFVKKGWCGLADGRNQIQVCFWCSKRPLDAKFQNKIKNKDSLLHNVCHLSSKNKFQFTWYVTCLNKIPQVNSKAARKYSTKIKSNAWFWLSCPFCKGFWSNCHLKWHP